MFSDILGCGPGRQNSVGMTQDLSHSSLVGRSQVDRSSLSPAIAPVAVGLTGSLLRQNRAGEKKIVLSINRRSHWRKSVWRKVVEAEAVAIFVNDNVAGKRGGGRRKIVGRTFASGWESTKDFFRRVRSCHLKEPGAPDTLRRGTWGGDVPLASVEGVSLFGGVHFVRFGGFSSFAFFARPSTSPANSLSAWASSNCRRRRSNFSNSISAFRFASSAEMLPGCSRISGPPARGTASSLAIQWRTVMGRRSSACNSKPPEPI